MYLIYISINKKYTINHIYKKLKLFILENILGIRLRQSSD